VPFDATTGPLAGRVGAHRSHSLHDSRELTAGARTAFLSKFLEEVDPERKLPEAERQRRADHALRAHMAALALRSAQVRRERATPRSRRHFKQSAAEVAA